MSVMLRKLLTAKFLYAVVIVFVVISILVVTFNYGRSIGRKDIKRPARSIIIQCIKEQSVRQPNATGQQKSFKYPHEIIDVNKHYPQGPPDVTWPDDVNIKLPEFDTNKPVPNILHYAWYGGSKRGNTIKEHHYISMLSGFKRLKPKRILFWYDERPNGKLWLKLRRTTKHVLQMVNRAAPTEIFGRPVAVPEHLTDIIRLEAVMFFGGVYTDLDVIVLKDFAPLYKHDITMGYEVDYGLCNGIIITKPSAPFLSIWYDAYHTFNDEEWSEHSVKLPARLAKERPKLIHTEATSMHKPNWQQLNQIYGNETYDWSKNYAIHLWIRMHGREYSIEELRTHNSTYGQISRYTLFDSPNILN